MNLDEVHTLPALTRWRVQETPGAEAYRWFDAGLGRWVGYSWREIDQRFDLWRRALAAEKFARGDRTAILAPNGIEHVSMDQAALSLGLVPVPLHAIDNPESINYILGDSGAALLMIESLERWQILLATGGPFESLKRVVYLAAATAGKPAGEDARAIALDQWLASDKARAARPEAADIKPSDLAAIVYTSGTTGRPKGVMLSHQNVVANVKAILDSVPSQANDVFLSFLPLSHTFERTAGYYFPIAVGACVAFARSVQHLQDDLKIVRPTVLASVPRIYERFYAGIMQRLASASWLQRRLFELTLQVGHRRFEARQGRAGPPPLSDRLLWPILKRLVADKVLAQFGGRLRVAVSGGAPIAEPIARLFLSLGLDVLQGYGLTEASPVVSTNIPEDNDPRSVGRALKGLEVRIGENQELLVRGPSVMVGYWHRPEETARVLGPDGWLHTGDQARIEAGRITIIGRIKDIIVTSTGEKVAPADLETAIASDPLFEQVMVVGENRPFVAALVVLNAEAWAKEKARIEAESAGKASKPTELESAFLLQRIAKATRGIPAYAAPRAVWWTSEPWTIAGGLLTPTLKVKRPALERRLASEIERLYAPRSAAR